MSKGFQDFTPAMKAGYGTQSEILLIDSQALRTAAANNIDRFLVPLTAGYDEKRVLYRITEVQLVLAANNGTGAPAAGTANYTFRLVKNDDTVNGVLWTGNVASTFAVPEIVQADLRGTFGQPSNRGIPLIAGDSLRLDMEAIPAGGTFAIGAGVGQVRARLLVATYGCTG